MEKATAKIYSMGHAMEERFQASEAKSYASYLDSLDFQQLILESYELINLLKVGPLTNELVGQCQNLVGHLSTRLSFSSNDMDQSFSALKVDLSKRINEFKGLLQTL